MLRTKPRQVLERSPLVHVLAQLMFSSPVFAMRRYLPEIHDALRGLGLGETQEGQETELVLSPEGVQTTQPRTRWDFLRADRRWGVVLTEQMVVLHTTQYDTFETFINLLHAATQAVLQSARLEQLQRIGLRYTDRVRTAPEEHLEEYVIPAMLGFPREYEAELGSTRLFARSDTLLKTAAGALAIRCFEGAGLPLPPDLVPTPLALDEVPQEERVLLLDFDHFAAGPMPADADMVCDAFWTLHDPLDIAFRTVATDHAWERWGRRFVE